MATEPGGALYVLARPWRWAEDALAGPHELPLWRLAGIGVGLIAALALLSLALGWIFAPRIDGAETVALPAPPPITEAERTALRAAEPEFERGLPRPALQAWSIVPATGLYAPRADAVADLRRASDLINGAAAARAQGQTPSPASLSEAATLLKGVKRGEGRDQPAASYHLGLVSILAGDPMEATRAQLQDALGRADAGAKKHTDAGSQRRAASVRASVLAAQAEAELAHDQFAAAETDFDSAFTALRAARGGGDARSILFKIDPGAALSALDSGPLLSGHLLAAQRAGDIAAVTADLTELGQQPQFDWSGRGDLLVDAQLVAADRGLWPLIQGAAPMWSADDPPAWQDLSSDARFIAGADFARSADDPDGPNRKLAAWTEIRRARETLRASTTLSAFRSALAADAFRGKSDLAAHWRDETARRLGKSLLDDGLEGSRPRGAAFILAASGVFPLGQTLEAAAREGAFGLGFWPRAAVMGALFLLLLLAVQRLRRARRSYRLTFSRLHHSDWAADQPPAAPDPAPDRTPAANDAAPDEPARPAGETSHG